jgi:type I restriction enzyme R subunit
MRQAIEEAFILDVLKHYTTYATYFKLLKACDDASNVERKKAAKALARFMRLHPHHLAQKTEVMVEHFNAYTRHKIGGRAKAMVVTSSRLEAVRYKQSFDRYIQKKGYPIKTLVAFSGTVQDDKLADVTYTEEGMNRGIREKELPEKFATQEYQVLLVAEKYQTGFDQPLLHTMYVDKRLAGIQAVQTLSRLNRIHPLKEDTFVLDFVNDREEIREALKTYYEGAEMARRSIPRACTRSRANSMRRASIWPKRWSGSARYTSCRSRSRARWIIRRCKQRSTRQSHDLRCFRTSTRRKRSSGAAKCKRSVTFTAS